MSGPKDRGQRFHFLPMLVGLITVGAVAMAGVMLREGESTLVTRAGESLALAAVEIAGQLDRLLAERYGDIEVASTLSLFKTDDRRAMTEYLLALQEAYPVYGWLGVADAHGQVIAATDPRTVGLGLGAQPGFQHVQAGQRIDVQGEARLPELDGDGRGVLFTARIAAPHGGFHGAVMSMVMLPVLEDAFTQTITALQAQWGSALRLEYQFLTSRGDVIIDSLLREEGRVNLRERGVPSAILVTTRPSGFIEERHSRRATAVITGYAATKGSGQFTGLGWGMLVRVDRDDILASIHSTLRRVGLMGAGMLVPLIGALLWGMVRLQEQWTLARREHERAALAEARFRELFESAPDAILVADSEGRLQSANKQFETLFGYEAACMIGEPIEFLLPERFRERHRGQRGDYMVAPHARPMGSERQLLARRRDGTEFPSEISLSPIHTAGGRHVIAIVRDVTAQRATQAKLAEAAERLAAQNRELTEARDAALEAVRLKSEFVDTMSHEIRTPLNGIVGMTALLLDSNLTAEQRGDVMRLKESVERLSEIIEDILDFSKLEGSGWTVESIRFDLRTLLEEVVGAFEPRANHKSLQLDRFVDADVPDFVVGDPGRIRQILSHLLSNALKFTDQGGVEVGVARQPSALAGSGPEDEMGAAQTGSASRVTIRFTVTDTGIGIDPGAKDHLFLPFTQADGSRCRRHGGIGLGLPISKKLVEAMGGTMGVGAREGGGSHFWFLLPMAVPSTAESKGATDSFDLKGVRALVVDPNPLTRLILEHHCRSWGMACECLASGMEALKALESAQARGAPFQVVLLEKILPDLEGLELAAMIKANPAFSPARVVIVTGVAKRGDAAASKQVGVDAYLPKPVHSAELCRVLGTILGSPRPSGQPSADGDQPTDRCAGELMTRHRLAEEDAARQPRVLVAVHHPANRLMMNRVLANLGYRADVVGNGQRAVAAAAKKSYAVVLLDGDELSDMNKFLVARAIREREAFDSEAKDASRTASAAAGGGRRVPIIALTNHVAEHEHDTCLAAGIDECVSLPITIEALSLALKRGEETNAGAAA